MNSPPLGDASRQTGCVRVSVCPEGGGYTCSLLVAEEKGDLIGSQRGAGQAGTCSLTRSDSLLVVCSLAWLLAGSVTQSVCLSDDKNADVRRIENTRSEGRNQHRDQIQKSNSRHRPDWTDRGLLDRRPEQTSPRSWRAGRSTPSLAPHPNWVLAVASPTCSSYGPFTVA